jgi:class 3 adenylate cyclase/tetratricopeptide (TPR) repeat protein
MQPGISSGRGESGQSAASLAPPRSRQTRRPASLSRGRYALDGDEQRGGARRVATVLFADIEGSTALVESVDPEEALDLLTSTVRLMRDAVEDNGGAVIDVAGDGIMALFGAPTADPDHAWRACQAALGIQAAQPRIRVGLSSGEIVGKWFADGPSHYYVVAGTPVNLAARIQQMAEGGAVLASASVLELAGSRVVARSLGTRSIRGFRTDAEIFEVVGLAADAGQAKGARRRRDASFVGRQNELASLHRLADAVGDGSGRSALVVGEPGIGKSRLVQEFGDALDRAGWTILRSDPGNPSESSGQPEVASLVRAATAHAASDPGGIEALAARAGALAGSEPLLAAAVDRLLERDYDGAAWVAAAPALRERATALAPGVLLQALASERPLLVVIEDLHLVDAETEAILLDVVDRLRQARALAVMTARPAYACSQPQLLDLATDLPPLAAPDVAALLREELGTGPAMEPLAERIIRIAAGNPLFIEEILLDLIHRNQLGGVPGDRQVLQSVEQIEAPASVHAIVAARIDWLDPTAREVLLAAAVVGVDVRVDVLRAVTRLPVTELARALDLLDEERLLSKRVHEHGMEVRFRHLLIMEVAYRSVLRSRRRELHRQVLSALESSTEARADMLGYHALCAGEWSRAAGYLERAGSDHLRRAETRQALKFFEGALSACQQGGNERRHVAEGVRIRLRLAAVLLPLGQRERMLEHLLAAQREATQIADQPLVGRVMASLSNCHWRYGAYQEGIAASRKALQIAEELGDVAATIGAAFALGLCYLGAGDLRQSLYNHRKVVAAIGPAQRAQRFGWIGSPVAITSTFMVWSYAELGEFAEGDLCARDALVLARQNKDQYGRQLVSVAIGHLLNLADRYDEALAYLAEAYDDPSLVHQPTIKASLLTELAVARHGAGDVEGALSALREAADSTRGFDMPTYTLDRFRLIRSTILLASGDRATASQEAAAAIESAERHGERCLLAWGWLARAHCAAAGDTAGAEQDYRLALEQAGQYAFRVVHCRAALGLGTLLAGDGRTAEGRRLLQQARDQADRLGLRRRLDAAEAALAALGD